MYFDSSTDSDLQHLLLGVEVEVGEGLGGQPGLDQPQDVDLFAGRQGIDQVGEVGGVPAIDDLAQRVVIVGLDQLSDLGERQLSQHRVSTLIPSRSKGENRVERTQSDCAGRRVEVRDRAD